MFPLGSVLMPAMPLPLRLFEPRYLAMLEVVLEREGRDFGVVLIERGFEVGGGDTRFDIGTLARVEQVEASDAGAVLIAQGVGRVRVDEWLPDDPFPQAVVSPVDPLTWDESDRALLESADRTVRSGLARAKEFIDSPWDPGIELSDDPVAHAWQLAGIAPIGALDQLRLLRATSITQLLTDLVDTTQEMVETLGMRIAGPED